jgi:hypothetical protein
MPGDGVLRGIEIICITSFIEQLDLGCEYLPIFLNDVYRFYEMICSKIQNRPSTAIILCTGPSPYTQFGTLFLLGCYLIMTGMDLHDVFTTLMDLEYVTSTCMCQGLSALDFWSALHGCKQMGWVAFDAEDELNPNSTLTLKSTSTNQGKLLTPSIFEVTMHFT